MKKSWRAWDKENNKFFEPIYKAHSGEIEELYLNQNGELMMRTMCAVQHESTFPDRFVVSRFTGQYDKNKVPVYEGDIVIFQTSYEREGDEFTATKEHPCIVEYSTKICGFFPFTMNIRWRCEVEELEVIGNIYQHPHLLPKE